MFCHHEIQREFLQQFTMDNPFLLMRKKEEGEAESCLRQYASYFFSLFDP